VRGIPRTPAKGSLPCAIPLAERIATKPTSESKTKGRNVLVYTIQALSKKVR
jgi:hypothetical protein